MWSSSCSNAAERRLSAALLAVTIACGPAAASAQVAAAAPGAPRADASAAGETSPNWRNALPAAQPLGGGDLTWFGLRIYRATLWSAQRPFDPAQPFALQLQYYRSISRERLVRTSIDEIRRLATAPLPDATVARWQALLTSALVDVGEGDELIGVYLPQHGLRLYDRQRLLAELDEPALARAFFDIWLNPASRDQTLRRRLLGAAP